MVHLYLDEYAKIREIRFFIFFPQVHRNASLNLVEIFCKFLFSVDDFQVIFSRVCGMYLNVSSEKGPVLFF